MRILLKNNVTESLEQLIAERLSSIMSPTVARDILRVIKSSGITLEVTEEQTVSIEGLTKDEAVAKIEEFYRQKEEGE